MRFVQKFGGTSLAGAARLERAASLIQAQWQAGHEVVVVVSAMAGATNRLIELVQSVSRFHDTREYDTIVSSGEQVSAGLLALVLQKRGIPARSWQGWQLPIHTDGLHGRARVLSVATTRLEEQLRADRTVAVCTGFQGLSPAGRLTTLGRGGSDTTAVLLAAALRADRCDIYTDVEGVYTADPFLVPRARKMDIVSYEEMLELASVGAKVLQIRAIEAAYRHSVPLHVLSSFTGKPGTLILDEKTMMTENPEENPRNPSDPPMSDPMSGPMMEKHKVVGIACDAGEAKISVRHIPDRPGIASRLFAPITRQGVVVDMIVQTAAPAEIEPGQEPGQGPGGPLTDMTFTVPKPDLARVLRIIEDLKEDLGYARFDYNQDIVKLSVVGIGMRSHSGVAQTMFQTLADQGINILVISTSEIRLSVLIEAAAQERAIRALHTAYGLDAPAAPAART